MSFQNRFGLSALHRACMNLSMSDDDEVTAPFQCNENMARICRFLVSECPQSVRYMEERGVGRGLPIHYLARRCNRSLVQGVLILLLREYPECMGQSVASRQLPNLSEVPFIQQVAPVLQLQADIQQERAWLVPASTNFLTYTQSIGMANVGEHFATWSNHRTFILQKWEETNQKKIDEICRNFEGDDVDEEDESDSEEEDESESDDLDEEDESGSSDSDEEDANFNFDWTAFDNLTMRA